VTEGFPNYLANSPKGDAGRWRLVILEGRGEEGGTDKKKIMDILE
jgi:hypothetical protein